MAFDEPTMQTERGAYVAAATQPENGTAARRKSKWKWLKRILFGTIFFALIGWVVGSLLLRSWTAKPPAIPVDAAILQLKTQERDGKVWLGQSWVGRREGLLTV